MTITRRLAGIVAVTAAVALLLAGCGDDDEADAGETAAVPEGVAAQYETIEEEVGAEGGETSAGDWRIAYIVEPAEPWFEGDRFREPAPGETNHVEILPIETSTGRLVPHVPITVEVLDASGEVVDTRELSFYYAEFFHYANNFSIPEAGTYTLRAEIGAPGFRRHGDQANGPALVEGASVEFEGVELGPEE